MADTTLAVYVLAGLALVLAIAIPLLNAIPKLSNFISLRWSCIAIVLLIMVGVVINFEPLADSTRDIALTGGIVVVGIYLVLRTVEKILYNGWLKGVNLRGTVVKGDTTATVEVTQTGTSVDVENKEVPKEIEEELSTKEESKSE